MEKEKALQAISFFGGLALGQRIACHDFRGDKDVVMAAVINNGYALRYASDELKEDKEVVMAAGSCGFKYASEEIKEDKEFCIQFLKENPIALKYMSDSLREDKDVVMAALNTGNSFVDIKVIGDNLKADKEVIMGFLNNGAKIDLNLISEELRADKEVVMASLQAYIDDSERRKKEYSEKQFGYHLPESDAETISSNYKSISNTLKEDDDIMTIVSSLRI